jgi:hypothetical protein
MASAITVIIAALPNAASAICKAEHDEKRTAVKEDFIPCQLSWPPG